MSEPASDSHIQHASTPEFKNQPDGTGHWRFFVDVGGTFTDVVAASPDGCLHTHKCLSSGVTRGLVEEGSTPQAIRDLRRAGDPAGFWIGFNLTVRGGEGDPPFSTLVVGFDHRCGTLKLRDPCLLSGLVGSTYELSSGEEAPVVAIRYLLGLGRDANIGPIELRLGTTRATNALLERKGAVVAFVTTAGFADVLKIGYQDRPRLFELNIRKRDELAGTCVEVDERIAADGEVLQAPDSELVRRQLQSVVDAGVDSLAICLLHAHVNPSHEQLVAQVAREVGFEHVSVSSEVARLQKIVARGDTCVVDAYVDPVIRTYIASLRESLPQARFRMMSSHGGLIGVDAARGKDTLLSGPAGGVVACAHIARTMGVDKAIGFDMGGTSTDVARIDPPPHQFEYQHETVKAGVRLMTPMLAIETVAAGGGSICRFDGQKLVVGPESAGASPGPACYGVGGPLTVTDVNLWLGRILPAHFPFPLSLPAVEEKLEALCADIGARAGTSYSTTRLADGFRQIANANMAAAVKRISLAKGYDAREYALFGFGGAAGQHACDVARILGINRILFHPLVGVLSAFGIGVADVKRIEEQSVDELLNDETERKLEPMLHGMASRLHAALLAEGVATEAIAEPVRTYDVCYAGQGSVITVPVEQYEAVRSAFETEHRRIYGYVHGGRNIEVRAIRVERVGEAPKPPAFAGGAAPIDSPECRTAELVVDGERKQVPVLLRGDMSADREVTGPAIIVEETSTIVIEAGWRGRVEPNGVIVLESLGEDEVAVRVDSQVDPTDLELFNNQFAATAEQMGVTLQRTALSTNVKERLDFSCAIFTPDGDLVVNAPHIPVHLGAMSGCVKALIADTDRLDPGDVFITNDPYRGGSHLNDVTVITPVHDKATGRLQFFVASRAHHAEIGGTRPGSMPPDSTCLAEEGVLIRSFRWLKDRQSQEAALLEILSRPPYPSRAPQENIMDIAAQVAANQRGVVELGAMIQKYGEGVVGAYMRHVQDAAEAKMRDAFRQLPDGCHRFQDRMDNGAIICLEIEIDDDHATFDFAGTSQVQQGNLNANRSIVASAILYCMRCLLDEDIPLNAGVMAPITLRLPECFLNPPMHTDPMKCPAVVGGNVETSQRIVDCIFGALGMVAASQGTMNNLLMGNKDFGYYETICGGAGAGPGFHGADGVHTNMTNTRMTDPEILESRYPVRLVRFSIRSGSGGRGRYCGGDGVVREFEFLEPLSVSILSQRREIGPYGLAGGEPGRVGRNLYRAANSAEWTSLPAIASLDVHKGDRLRIETPGGGGWGDDGGHGMSDRITESKTHP